MKNRWRIADIKEVVDLGLNDIGKHSVNFEAAILQVDEGGIINEIVAICFSRETAKRIVDEHNRV